MKHWIVQLSGGLVLLLTIQGCSVLKELGLYRPTPTAAERFTEFKSVPLAEFFSFPVPAGAKVDTFAIDSIKRIAQIRFNDEFACLPFRDETVEAINHKVKAYFSESLPGYTYTVQTLHHPIEDLVPNYFRIDPSQFDTSRMPRTKMDRHQPVVRNVSKGFVPSRGLFNRNIGLWNSHGWHYNNKVGRWEWQRPRLFQTVEDLGPTAFVLPYIIPMLENAGASVFLPRERDIQSNEVIVDNDDPSSGYGETSMQKRNPWKTEQEQAFAVGTPPYKAGVNPFHQGTARSVQTDSVPTAEAVWIPTIPLTSSYAVYISYVASDSNAMDASYRVFHTGGVTEFMVNQQIGGRTWQYLGLFKFFKGRNPEKGKVVLINRSNQPGKIVSADAVRFGGGMGVIERGGSTGGRPKFTEGSRYYLQFAGLPDSLVYDFSRGKDDYKDDYQSRAEYLNYLTGAPYGPNPYRDLKGLGIPIDLSLAFHTNAGITQHDTTYGTLSIYSLEGFDSTSTFPDGMSRLANRDLADLIQTQIVDDLRAKWDPIWFRKQLRNADYSESRRPNIPSVLLELLSHQNFLDMEFLLDPRFRFDVSRSIYKSILRFVATQNSLPYVIQPLPVTHFAALLNSAGNVELRWKPQRDSLEPSAVSTRYRVRIRTHDGDFDNGFLVDSARTIIQGIQPEVVYGFQVTAINDGGESFPSEILSVCRMDNGRPPVLIVNGFDRICGPGMVNTPEYRGFLSDFDRGVPDRYDLGFTGGQYDLTWNSPFRTNDAPGHGASFADHEGKIIAGNKFDYPYVHGVSIKQCGYSFVSVSDEAVMDSMVDLSNYACVDLILGKEKETHWQKSYTDSLYGTQFKAFPPFMQTAIRLYCQKGGNLFVSGAYVGSDLCAQSKKDTLSGEFARDILKFTWVTDHAARTGKVFSVDSSFIQMYASFAFNVELNDSIYAVESPDEIIPDGGSKQLLRYAENQFGAAVGYKKEYGVVVCGFPFETILGVSARNEFMKSVFRLFGM